MNSFAGVTLVNVIFSALISVPTAVTSSLETLDICLVCM